MAHPSAFAQNPALSPRDRTLRVITSLTLLPAFGLLLAHGIVTTAVFPALCLLPMGFSAALAAALLLGHQPVRVVQVLADPLLCVWYFAFLLPSWIVMHRNTHRRWGRAEEPVLAAYGTVPVMVNFAIHLFFLHTQAAQLLRGLASRFRISVYERLPSTCPHCEGDVHVDDRRQSQRAGSRRRGNRGDDHNSLYSDDSKQQTAEYRDIIDQEDVEGPPPPSATQGIVEWEPRPSTDDETARLV